LFSFLAVRLGIASLPQRVNFRQIIGLAFLGGIGFTMSIFISNLSFEYSHLLNSSKIGILLGSFIASVIGYFIIQNAVKKKGEILK
jgi:NhaA family Na+:H+ antiporter